MMPLVVDHREFMPAKRVRPRSAPRDYFTLNMRAVAEASAKATMPGNTRAITPARKGGPMLITTQTTKKLILAAAAIAVVGLIGTASAQQQARPQPARGQPAEPAKDYNQRSLEIYEFRKAAQSGPARGQEIYFYKCWMCHNELAQGGAPKLVGLFKRANAGNRRTGQRRQRQEPDPQRQRQHAGATSTCSTTPIWTIS